LTTLNQIGCAFNDKATCISRLKIFGCMTTLLGIAARAHWKAMRGNPQSKVGNLKWY
jgi:hypothetical protein